MATTELSGNPVHTVGELPQTGSKLPHFRTTGTDLNDVTEADFPGKRLVLNIFPSVDTGVCAASVREFNRRAADLQDTVVITVSEDLPFALGRFCGAEGLENVVPTSAFRSSFGRDFGVQLVDSPMKGLLARSVIVADADGTVLHSQLVPEITQEPDYDAALASLS